MSRPNTDAYGVSIADQAVHRSKAARLCPGHFRRRFAHRGQVLPETRPCRRSGFEAARRARLQSRAGGLSAVVREAQVTADGDRHPGAAFLIDIKVPALASAI